MRVFLVPEDVVVASTRYSRHYRGKSGSSGVPVDMLFIDTGGELDVVNKALAEQRKNKLPADEKLELPDDKSSIEEYGKVTVVGEPDLLNWPDFPPRLGRVSTRFFGPGMYSHEELAPLEIQLTALKAMLPHKQHFRIAAVASFGTNLGDSLMGMTAMRVVVETLRRHLPSFIVDMLLCTSGNPANIEIVGYEPWIGELHAKGPSVTDFARYDAYFDFTGLIGLPRITEMPMVDWFIWWSGLNPSTVPADRKRNVLNIPWVAWGQVSPLLQGIAGKRILFNPKASVSLRSFPEKTAIAFAKKLLKLDKDLQLIIDKPLNFEHPRLVDLSKQIDSPQKFEALIAQMDGVITVDTFGIHVADAANVPTVGLFASIPPDAYPFYPLHHGMLIPGAEELPAYRKFKVNDDKEWEQVKDLYTQAWANLDAAEVLNGLKETMDHRQHTALHQGLRFVHGVHKPVRYCETSNGRKLPFESRQHVWDRSVIFQKNMACSVLKPGGTVVVIAPGQSDFSIALAEKLGQDGTLHLFEPRQLRRTLIGMDLFDQAGLSGIHWHDALPVKSKQMSIPDEDALCETNPLHWGSLKKQRKIEAQAVDALELPVFSGLFSFAPAPHLLVLESAIETLKRTKAPVVCSPVASEEDVRKIAVFLIPLGYQCWIEYIEQREGSPIMLMAIADHIKVGGHSMKRVVLS
ncbi:MAG: glycosyltransferase family 9 protein [Chlorobiaceae bacterium]